MLLAVEDLHFAYGKIQALNGVSLQLKDKEIHAIVGANGSGKSTLMRCIAGVYARQQGSITLDGEELPAKSHEVVAKGISLVPEGRWIFPNLSVEENLRLGGYLVKDCAPGLQRSFDMFPRLKERRNQRAGTLSGGEQQMLAIARGLMSNPKILLLDEPSLGLAPIIVNDVMAIIDDINQSGVSVLLVEQNARKALALAHTASVMSLGKIVRTGSGDELAADGVIEAYLGKRRL